MEDGSDKEVTLSIFKHWSWCDSQPTHQGREFGPGDGHLEVSMCDPCVSVKVKNEKAKKRARRNEEEKKEGRQEEWENFMT